MIIPKLVPDNDTVACGLPQKKATLTLPSKSHPLFPKLQLLAICLLGKQWEIEAFRRKL